MAVATASRGKAMAKSVSEKGSDPRLKSAERPYVSPVMKPEDMPFEFSSLIAIISGLMGVLLRQKIGCILAVIFIVRSLAKIKNWETDLKQVMFAVTFASMGIITIYFGPVPPTS